MVCVVVVVVVGLFESVDNVVSLQVFFCIVSIVLFFERKKNQKKNTIS